VVRELNLTIVYEPGDDWIIASIPEVADVFSQGQTREEARENVLEALKLMLSPEPRADDDRREREPLHDRLKCIEEACRLLSEMQPHAGQRALRARVCAARRKKSLRVSPTALAAAASS
jgi:predicted RNase H-like HicB family nuclease